MTVRNHNKCKDGIRLNPKCLYNGNLVAKPRNRKVKRLVERRTLQAIGSGNGWLLTGNAEDEEIVFSRSERKWLSNG